MRKNYSKLNMDEQVVHVWIVPCKSSEYVKHILSQYLAIPPEKITFDYTPLGKPFLPRSINPLQYEFNISHSKSLLACCITQSAMVGIDIEYIEPFEEEEKLACMFFSDKEVKEYLNLPVEKRTKAFFHIWTRKESLIKAIGSGFYFDLKSFDVTSDNRTNNTLVNQPKNMRDKFYIYNLNINESFVAALAINREIKKIFFFDSNL